MTSSHQKLVSVIAVCYNHSMFVEENLNSISDQSYKNIELIIIDDFSTDNSRHVIETWISNTNYPCVFIKNETNIGLCKTLNKALSFTHGDYVNIIATDDILLPNKIEVQVEVLNNSNENIAFTASDMVCIDEFGKVVVDSYLNDLLKVEEFPFENQFELLIRKNYIPAPSLLIKRNIFDKIGYYDETLKYEDYDFSVRCLSKHNFIGVNEKLVNYRLLETSLSNVVMNSNTTRSTTYLKVYLKVIANVSKPKKRILSEQIFHHSIILYKNNLYPYKELFISFRYLLKFNILLYSMGSFFRMDFIFINNFIQKIKTFIR